MDNILIVGAKFKLLGPAQPNIFKKLNFQLLEKNFNIFYDYPTYLQLTQFCKIMHFLRLITNLGAHNFFAQLKVN